jgi:hypothetical protein
MASLAIHGDELVVRLSPLERIVALHGDVHVPISCVRSVCAEPDPWAALRGMRAPGTGLPGMVAFGVRRMTGARPDFAAVWGRRPAIRVELAPGSRYGRLVVTVSDPTATLTAMRGALGSVRGAERADGP